MFFAVLCYVSCDVCCDLCHVLCCVMLCALLCFVLFAVLLDVLCACCVVFMKLSTRRWTSNYIVQLGKSKDEH